MNIFKVKRISKFIKNQRSIHYYDFRLLTTKYYAGKKPDKYDNVSIVIWHHYGNDIKNHNAPLRAFPVKTGISLYKKQFIFSLLIKDYILL